jgi:hypothetical protein
LGFDVIPQEGIEGVRYGKSNGVLCGWRAGKVVWHIGHGVFIFIRFVVVHLTGFSLFKKIAFNLMKVISFAGQAAYNHGGDPGKK